MFIPAADLVHCPAELIMKRIWPGQLLNTRKFSSPTEGFFLAPSEGEGPSRPKVTLPDEQTDGFTGVRFGLKLAENCKLTGRGGRRPQSFTKKLRIATSVIF